MLLNLVEDLISIQVLYMLTTVMQMVVKGEASTIQNTFNGAVMICNTMFADVQHIVKK